MLLFIAVSLATIGFSSKFQYISCYCLSINHLNQQSRQQDFNTSHVTVYLSDSPSSAPERIFQYISCYCLSSNHLGGERYELISIHLMLLFIADWKHLRLIREKDISIHLMLMFIGTQLQKDLVASGFQYISCYCLSVHCRRHRS